MSDHHFSAEIRVLKEFFDRSTHVFTEEHSGYTPVPGTFTVVNHVAHTARTIEWFVEGAFRPEGFSMDFEKIDAEACAETSLTQARAWMDRAVAAAIATIESKSMADMLQPLPEGPVMGGQPRAAIIGAITDHTAHHRGALTVYARMLGLKPLMPYMEM